MRKNALLLVIFLFSNLYVSAQNIPITEGALDACNSKGKMIDQAANLVDLQLSTTINGQRVILENSPKPENIWIANNMASNYLPNSGNSSTVLNEILKRMEAHQKNLKSLRADIKMINYDSQFNDREIFEGSAIYLPSKTQDSMVRIDLAKPRKEIFVSLKGKYLVYMPILQQVFTGNLDRKTRDPFVFLNFSREKLQNPLAFLNFSRKKFKTNFKIKFLGQEKLSDQIPVWHLEFTPKDGTFYKSVELWLDINGMPVQVKLIEKNDNYSIIHLSNVRKNVPVNASEFKVILPKETKLVKN